MKIALSTCWVNAPSARRHRFHQGESAVSVHLDHPDRLLDVVVAGELEAAERRVDVDGFHRVAKLGAITGGVAEGQVGSFCRSGEDQDRSVALGRELVRIGAVLGTVRLYEPSVRGERVVDVPGAAALRTLAIGAGLLRHLCRVESVAAKKLSGESLLARLDHDLGRDRSQAGDEDDVGILLHGLGYRRREVGGRLAELHRVEQLNPVLTDGALYDLAAV